jgi:hypothetical protein
VSLDNFRLFVFRSLLLGLSQLLQEGHWLALQTAVELSASTSIDEINELYHGC